MPFSPSLQHFIKITIQCFYQIMTQVISALGWCQLWPSIFAYSPKYQTVNLPCDFHSLINPRKVINFSICSGFVFLQRWIKNVQTLYMLEINRKRQVFILNKKEESYFFKCLVPSNYHTFLFRFLLCLNVELYGDDLYTHVLANKGQAILRKSSVTVGLWEHLLGKSS